MLKNQHILSPPAEIQQEVKQNYVDSYGDTWDHTGTVKIAFADPQALLRRQDAIRAQIRADLDALGLRDGLGTMDLGNGVFVEGPSPAFNHGEVPSTELLLEKAMSNSRLTVEDFDRLLNRIYEEGANPDIVLVSLEKAFEHGLIGPWEFRWRKLLRSIGTWKRNVFSGARSALRTRGTPAREQ